MEFEDKFHDYDKYLITYHKYFFQPNDFFGLPLVEKKLESLQAYMCRFVCREAGGGIMGHAEAKIHHFRADCSW